MALLTGMTEDGREVPVQVDGTGKLVAEGLAGPAGPAGPQGAKGDTGLQGVKGDTGATGGAVFADGTGALPGLAPASDTDTGLYRPAANTLAFSMGGVERIRFDSTGRLMQSMHTMPQIGTSTGWGIVTAYRGIAVIRTGNDANPPGLTLCKTRSTVVNSFASVLAGDSIGQIDFALDNGVNYTTVGGRIACLADGTVSSSSAPTRMIFATTPSGSLNPVEHLRILSTGRVGLGVHSPSERLEVAGNVAANAIRLKSPDGSSWMISVDNAGAVSAAKVTA
jgi:hypothetical protein